MRIPITTALYHAEKLIRWLAALLSVPIIALMLPMKLLAFKSKCNLLKRVILEFTTFVDWCIVLANVQNKALLLYRLVYRGNFIFGKAIMVTDYETATKEIAQYTLRGNRFMGVDLVSNDPGVFVTNAGPITTGQPVRRLQREYIDQVILNARVRSSSTETLRTYCSEIIDEWLLDESMATALSIRSVVTRVYIRILTEKILPETFTREITFNYLRRFAEFSLFGRYAPTLIWLLGTREGIRKDVFIRLRRYNIDNVAIDMTMFAAMFSVGTNIMRCIELCRSHRLNYPSLSATEKVQFVIESQRLHPTVTTVHRIVEENEEFLVAGVRITADPGDEIDYPFVCINRDVTVFADPENFNPLRTFAELQKVLSWSTGSHVCPARDISIMSVVLLLDALSTQHDLSKLCVFNPEF